MEASFLIGAVADSAVCFRFLVETPYKSSEGKEKKVQLKPKDCMQMHKQYDGTLKNLKDRFRRIISKRAIFAKNG